jgi:hypothetical protein
MSREIPLYFQMVFHVASKSTRHGRDMSKDEWLQIVTLKGPRFVRLDRLRLPTPPEPSPRVRQIAIALKGIRPPAGIPDQPDKEWPTISAELSKQLGKFARSTYFDAIALNRKTKSESAD